MGGEFLSMVHHMSDWLKWLLPMVCAAAVVLAVHIALAEANKPEAEPPELGRLFTTARDRVSLKSARRRALAAKSRKNQEANATSSEPPPRLDRATVNGMITRSGGPPAVWMNRGSAIRAADALPEGVQIGESGKGMVMVELPGSKRLVTLKPGQRFDDKVNRVLEAYEVARLDEEEMKKIQEKKRKESKTKEKKAGGSKETEAKKGGDAKAKGADAKAIDRMGLGADGAALSDMMNQREQFQDKLEGMKSLLGR